MMMRYRMNICKLLLHLCFKYLRTYDYRQKVENLILLLILLNLLVRCYRKQTKTMR